MGTSFEAFSGKFEIPSMDRVWYGPNCLNQLAEEVERLHIRKAFVIASKSIRDQTDLVARLKEVLGDGFAGVSAESKQHVPRQAVLHASDEARKAGADALISLGGGSQIDCAKAVALCLAENISTREQLDDYRVRYEPPDKVTIPALKGTTVPHLALPTTMSAF